MPSVLQAASSAFRRELRSLETGRRARDRRYSGASLTSTVNSRLALRLNKALKPRIGPGSIHPSTQVVTLTCALAQTLYDPAAQDREYMMSDVQEAETLLMEALQASRQAFGAGHEQTARVRQELDAVRAARRGDEVDGSKLERGPIVLDKPDEGDEKTIDSID